MKIMLDMDGTWVDLYGVEDWLDDLTHLDTRPYRKAKPLVNLSWFARTIHELQAAGFEVGIISWLAKNPDENYAQRVTAAKLEWLETHLPSVKFDEIHIIPYGTPKSTCGGDFLFDDEKKNRLEWKGHAFDEKDLVKTLRMFLKNIDELLEGDE